MMRTMRTMRSAAATLLALGLACSTTNGHSDSKPVPGSGSGSTSTSKPPAAASTKATMDIKYQNLVDDKWKQAAEVVVDASRDVLATTKSARVVVQPYASPDGAIVPYLLIIEATATDGTPTFRGTGAVLGGKLANRGGASAATGFLAAAGFPAKHISLGHLLEVLSLTGAVDASWFAPPSAVGWEGITRPLLMTELVRSLEYTGAGAVLHLYRGVRPGAGTGAPASGGGFTPPEIERLDVTFDAKAAFTTTVLRQNAARTAWQPVP